MTHARGLCTVPMAERRRYIALRARHLADTVRGLRQQRSEQVGDAVLTRRRAVVAATLAAARAYVPTSSVCTSTSCFRASRGSGPVGAPVAMESPSREHHCVHRLDGCGSDTMLLRPSTWRRCGLRPADAAALRAEWPDVTATSSAAGLQQCPYVPRGLGTGTRMPTGAPR